MQAAFGNDRCGFKFGGTLQEESHGYTKSDRHALGQLAAPTCDHAATSRKADPRLAGRRAIASATAAAISAGVADPPGEQYVVLASRPDATEWRHRRLSPLQSLWWTMKSFRMNSPLIVLAAAMVTVAPFVGLAWRTRQWLGW
jgi:hypothetical protein